MSSSRWRERESQAEPGLRESWFLSQCSQQTFSSFVFFSKKKADSTQMVASESVRWTDAHCILVLEFGFVKRTFSINAVRSLTCLKI